MYRVRRADARSSLHADRGNIKDVFWRFRKANSSRCRGYGFVVDAGTDTIVVPESWKIPASDHRIDDYVISFERSIKAQASDPTHAPYIEGIIREALKRHLKGSAPGELGPLWQDYGSFCQMPQLNQTCDFHFCRRFSVSAKQLRGNRWVLEVAVNTSTLDSKTFADYYRAGKVEELADLIAAKQADRVNRQNQPTGVRVWRDESNDYEDKISIVELSDPDSVVAHGRLNRPEQRNLSSNVIHCQRYKQNPEAVPMDQIRLILDSQITLEDHEQTIIDPDKRAYLDGLLRDAVADADIYGKSLDLATEPFDTNDLPGLTVSLPAIRVRDKERGERILNAPSEATADAIQKRSRYRSRQIRENGFLQSRPVNLLLAAPKSFGTARAGKMRNSLNHILELQGIKYRFTGYFLFTRVEDIAREVENNKHSAAIVVLPEGSRAPTRTDDTHEQLKRTLEIPTQCIHHDNTLPASWVDKRPSEFRNAQPRLARRITERYQLCLGNLLVKCHWVPFAPSQTFHYNVHVGIDVGGQHNNTAVVCVGHGFANKRGPIVFRPDQIPIPVQQAEPIQPQYLLPGLRQPFHAVEAGLRKAGSAADFNRVLFFRDGSLLGDGEAWNEFDALKELHAEFLRKRWIGEDSIWTAVEVLKSAEGWRLIRDGQRMEGNPLVGRALFPFDDDMIGLVCTTGQPYLTQGTARPLKIRIVDIHGRASREEVVRDLVWEADMCLTKPDLGMRLPWVLHVADTGALQTARSYFIAGIPA